MNPLFIDLENQSWTRPASPAEAALMARFARGYFVPTPPPMTAWLLYEVKTKTSIGVVVGCYRPNKLLRRGKLRIGAVQIDPTYQGLLRRYGPDALRWNGKEIVVEIGTN